MGVNINGNVTHNTDLTTKGINFHALNGNGQSNVFQAQVTYNGVGTVTVVITDTTTNATGTWTFNDTLPGLPTGTLTLSHANSGFTGTATIDAGALQVADSNALENAVVSFGGGALTFDPVVSGIVDLGGLSGTAGIWTEDTSGAPVNVGVGPITATSAQSLTVSGTGRLTLLANNSNDLGSILIEADATVVADQAGAIGAGTGVAVASGGTLAFEGGFSDGSEPVSIAGTGAGGNGALENLNSTQNYAGLITVTGSATINSAAGTLTLAGITLTSGDLSFAGNGSTHVTGTINGPSSTPGLTEFQLADANSYNDQAWAANHTIADAEASGSDTVQKAVMGETTGGDGAIQPVGSHTWATNNTWVYVGNVWFPNSNGDGTGTLSFAKQVDDATWLSIGTQNGVINNGTWNQAVSSGPITLPAGWYPIEVNFSNGNGGAGPMNGQGTGWNSSYGFGFRVDAGASDPLASSTNGNDYIIPDNATVGSSIYAADFPNGIFSIGATSGVDITGAGPVTFSGTDAYHGATTVSAGSTLNLDYTLDASMTLNVAPTGSVVASNALNLNGNKLTVGGGGNVLISAAIIGTSASGLVMAGTGGTLTLSGDNSGFAGTIAVSSGTVLANAANALGSGSGITVAAGGTLALAGAFTASGSEALSLAGTGVGGVGALENVSGTHAYTGPITLTGNAAIGSAAGTLTVGAITMHGNNLTSVGNGSITVNGQVDWGNSSPGLLGKYYTNTSGNATNNQPNCLIPADPEWLGNAGTTGPTLAATEFYVADPMFDLPNIANQDYGNLPANLSFTWAYGPGGIPGPSIGGTNVGALDGKHYHPGQCRRRRRGSGPHRLRHQERRRQPHLDRWHPGRRERLLAGSDHALRDDQPGPRLDAHDPGRLRRGRPRRRHVRLLGPRRRHQLVLHPHGQLDDPQYGPDRPERRRHAHLGRRLPRRRQQPGGGQLRRDRPGRRPELQRRGGGQRRHDHRQLPHRRGPGRQHAHALRQRRRRQHYRHPRAGQRHAGLQLRRSLQLRRQLHRHRHRRQHRRRAADPYRRLEP